MPPLPRPEHTETVELPPRTARVAAETDVLVVGGGPAGLGAALGAAAAGARVVLAERYGFLGGHATAALVTILAVYYTITPQLPEPGAATLFPTNHGPGVPVVRGALAVLVERLVRAGGALPPSMKTGHTVPFDPEVFKLVAQDLLDEAGVGVLLHALAGGVLRRGDRVDGVVFETKSGPLVIRARTVVDCTGDGDIAALAGAPFDLGREPDGAVQPMTLYFRMGEFRRAAFEEYVRRHPTQWYGVHGLWDLIRRAAEAGELDLPREDILVFGTPYAAEVGINSTRVHQASGVDAWDLTRAEWEGRRQMRQIAAFLRAYVPGFEDSYVLQSGVHIGVRETRRIRGEYTLTGGDVLAARRFNDVIARGTYPVDIHDPEGKGTRLTFLPSGEAYDIPLRCLIPLGLENLLTAGRCISGTHEAMSSYRVMPISMATGQAAGVCAALSVGSAGSRVREVPWVRVQSELSRQGAELGGAAGTAPSTED